MAARWKSPLAPAGKPNPRNHRDSGDVCVRTPRRFHMPAMCPAGLPACFPHGPHTGEGPGILPAHPARRPRSHRCTRERPPRRSNGRFSPFPPAAKTLLPLLHHELGHWTSAKRNTRLIPVLVIQIHKIGAETFQRSVRAALYLLLQIFSAVNMRFCSNRDFMAERNQRLVRRFLIAPRSATLRSVKMGQPISWAMRIGRIASSLGGNAPWP